jgi:hypothetical protein
MTDATQGGGSNQLESYDFGEIGVSPLFVSRFIRNLAGFRYFLDRLYEFMQEPYIDHSSRNADKLKGLVKVVSEELLKYQPNCEDSIRVYVINFHRKIDGYV